MAGNLGTDKDVEALVRRARRGGWIVDIDGGTHIRWRCPHGGEFRSPLTGGPSTRLRVQRNLAQLDPGYFARDGADPIAEDPEPVDFRVEAGAAAEELREAAALVELAAEVGDVDEALLAVKNSRGTLRDAEDRLHAARRSSRTRQA